MNSEFDPLMCFAKREGQTAVQVFDAIEERMRTLIGFHLGKMSEQDISLLVQDKDIDPLMAVELRDYHRSNILLTIRDFDKFASFLSMSMLDIMCEPMISSQDREALQKSLPLQNEGGIDPVKAYVFLSALDKIDEMVQDRKDWAAGEGVKPMTKCSENRDSLKKFIDDFDKSCKSSPELSGYRSCWGCGGTDKSVKPTFKNQANLDETDNILQDIEDELRKPRK